MKDYECAFPCNSPDGLESYKGMSLRDYFAGQALAGLYAGEGLRHTPDWYTQEAYKAADAMLAERGKAE
ncbi:MAG: hypothetical protein LBU85_09120 [Treponema sp.]|jgi:hypothetical protein|nr:hypothetical protein [Treponema sp.]